MAFIYIFFFFWKSLKKLKKLELSPLNSRYGVLHLLYSVFNWESNFGSFSADFRLVFGQFSLPSWSQKGHKPSRAELKILQLELWLEPARLGLITINYLSIWPFMCHPWFPTRKASKLTLQGLKKWSWKQINVSFEAFLVGNQGWRIKGQMLR